MLNPFLYEPYYSHLQLIFSISSSELTYPFIVLDKLEELVLNHNKISILPASIGRLTKLKSLELAHNQLTQLPEEVFKLDGLVKLELEGNDNFRRSTFEKTPGCKEFLERRKRNLDKQIKAGLAIDSSLCGLDANPP